jgi:hypothetical protein
MVTTVICSDSEGVIGRPTIKIHLMKTLSPPFDEMHRLSATQPGAPDGVDGGLDFEGRRWPTLPAMPRDRLSELENTIENLSAQLALRCTQVADLSNIREQQAKDLLTSCDEIDRLSASVDALHKKIAALENYAIVREQALSRLDKENVCFRLELEKSRKESAELLERRRSVEAAFNEREIAVVSIQERHAQIEAELIAAQAERFRIARSLEEENWRLRDELSRQSSHFEERIGMLESVAAARSERIKYLEESEAALTSQCEYVGQIAATLQSEKQQAQEEYESEAVAVLEALLKIERETSENKIRELTDTLLQVRGEQFKAERVSAVIRENIVLLLPKLAALQSSNSSSDPDPDMSKNNAA